MSEFKLIIVTPDGTVYNGMAESVIVRTVTGDVGILKGHEPYVAALGVGMSKIKINGEWKNAACSGGVINVDDESTKIVANTFEWADDIDVVRAEIAVDNAKKIIDSSVDTKTVEKAQIKLYRALTRLNVAKNK